MFRRMIGFVIVMVGVGALVGAIIASGLMALTGPGRWLVVAVTFLAILSLGFLARKMFRRTWAPVGELIDATKRLGDGESGVRIETRRPGPLAAVSASFNRMAERLEEEDARRRRFVADIGHELRTPMTVIRGEIEAVIDGIRPPESLSNVVDEVDLMDRLLDDLRVLSMAEAGTLRLEAQPTDLAELVREVLASFSRRLDAQSVRTAVSASPDARETAVDPHRMHQVLSNLVGNALDQMPDGGTLTVTLTHAAGSTVIAISDTGPGVPEDELEAIFDRFVRAGDSAGSGLGLSISRDLVAAHGGRLTAANTMTGGAVFTIRLPE